MSNEQHASTAAADIDSLALDVARRFTEEWDPQRRASLQVAIIQAIHAAHAQPAELAEQHGDSPIDVTDPWRGLYQASRLPAPTEYGDTFHPDIPSWPDDREDALDKLVRAQGFDFHIVSGEFTEAALEDGDDLYWQEMRAWNPEAPEGEWRLAWKGDTEDGPYAWFVRPMALRPKPVAPPAQGLDLHRLVPPEWISDQFGGPMADLTPGQAWRQGFNQCRDRTLLLVEQALEFPDEKKRDAAPGVSHG